MKEYLGLQEVTAHVVGDEDDILGYMFMNEYNRRSFQYVLGEFKKLNFTVQPDKCFQLGKSAKQLQLLCGSPEVTLAAPREIVFVRVAMPKEDEMGVITLDLTVAPPWKSGVLAVVIKEAKLKAAKDLLPSRAQLLRQHELMTAISGIKITAPNMAVWVSAYAAKVDSEAFTLKGNAHVQDIAAAVEKRNLLSERREKVARKLIARLQLRIESEINDRLDSIRQQEEKLADSLRLL